MIKKKRTRSEAMDILGNRLSMAKPAFVEEKRDQLKKRGIDVELLLQKHPRSQVIERLIEALPKTGVNRWVADQAAHEIYDRVEKQLIAEGKITAKPENRRMNKGNNKPFISANRERVDRRKFATWKNRLEPRIAIELDYSLKSAKMREGEVVKLVKMTYTYATWVKEHGLNGAEEMAVEIARDLKNKEIARREWLERIQTFGHSHR